MDYLKRKLETELDAFLQQNIHQVCLIYGARRIGKTTMLKKFLEQKQLSHLFKSGDDIEVQNILRQNSTEKLKNFIGNHKLFFLDEAQRIENIGYSLKILVDAVEDLKIFATGSSSLDLGKNIGEPLGGRAKILRCYPFAQLELNEIETLDQVYANLESRLIYGSYPVVALLQDNEERAEYLHETVSSYLLKDILEYDGIRNSNKLKQLLRLIAFQIGNEVSHSELGQQLSMSKDTVAKYLDLLEQSFVIYSRQGFSKNLRSEVTSKQHYYFFDNGIRNALINNFNTLEMRNDKGMLWENYILSERQKRNSLVKNRVNSFFWRTYEQQEIDLIEEKDGQLFAYEMKFTKNKAKVPPLWKRNYPEAEFELINSTNYLDKNFISCPTKI